MKKVYFLMSLALASLMAVGCMKEDEAEGSVDNLNQLILKNVSFLGDTKMHLDPSTYDRLLYDNNDEIYVNGTPFTLSRGEGDNPWIATGSQVSNDNGFFNIFYSDGELSNLDQNNHTTGRFDISGMVSSYGSTPGNPSSGIVLAGQTSNNVVTLIPCCAIIRLDTTNTNFDYIQIGFEYNRPGNIGNNKVVKRGIINAADGRITQSLAHMQPVSNGTGDFLQMKYSAEGQFYYVGVPLLGTDISTKLYIHAVTNSAENIQQETSNYVTIEKGKVYSIKLSPSGGYIQSFDDNGAMAHGVFTISNSGNTVKFSRGILQYKANIGRWFFAENQYQSMVGANASISSSNSDPIDLYGWGANGYGSNNYPYYTSSNPSDYYNGDLTGNYNWGINQIHTTVNGSVSAYSWRSLTKDEWLYLLNSRNGHSDKWGMGMIEGTNGIILLPDSWVAPSIDHCPAFVAGAGNGYSTNEYDADEWEYMEKAGAVFLPKTGWRNAKRVFSQGDGFYWTSSACYSLSFDGSGFSVTENTSNRWRGYAVRLVKDN